MRDHLCHVMPIVILFGTSLRDRYIIVNNTSVLVIFPMWVRDISGEAFCLFQCFYCCDCVL